MDLKLFDTHRANLQSYYLNWAELMINDYCLFVALSFDSWWVADKFHETVIIQIPQ